MNVLRTKDGTGGYIAFSEMETEVMFYTVKWLHEVLLDPRAKVALQKVVLQMQPEIDAQDNPQ